MSIFSRDRIEKKSRLLEAVRKCGAKVKGEEIIFADNQFVRFADGPGHWVIWRGNGLRTYIGTDLSVSAIQIELLSIHIQLLK